MNRKLYEQERHNILSTIAGASPDQRPVINLAVGVGIKSIVSAAIIFSPAALIATVNPILGLAALAAVGFPLSLHGVFSSLAGRDILPKPMSKFTSRVMRAVVGAFGKSVQASGDDQDLAEQWSHNHPEVAAAIYRWTKGRSACPLTYIQSLKSGEIDVLHGVVKASEALEKTFIASQAAEYIASRDRAIKAQEATLGARSPDLLNFEAILEDRRVNQSQVQAPGRVRGQSLS